MPDELTTCRVRPSPFQCPFAGIAFDALLSVVFQGEEGDQGELGEVGAQGPPVKYF